MCEDVVLERVKAENEQRILIVLADSVAPGLYRMRSMIDKEGSRLGDAVMAHLKIVNCRLQNGRRVA
jgi:hypothetical protein